MTRKSNSGNLVFLGKKAAGQAFYDEARPSTFSAERFRPGRFGRRTISVNVYPHKTLRRAFVWIVWRSNLPRDVSTALRGGRLTQSTLHEAAIFAVADLMGVQRGR